MAEVIEIALGNGGVTRISACDVQLVAGFRWRWWRCVDGQVYVRAHITRAGKRTTLLMHRLILGLQCGNPLEGDHRDGDGLNNTRENLRTATRFQNARNRRRTMNKHGFKGVVESSPGRFMAFIGDKSTGYLGCYATPAEAGAAYDRAAAEKYGEFAALNSDIRGDAR